MDPAKTLHVADQPDPDQGDRRCQPRRRHSHRQQGDRRLMLTQPRPEANHILESQIHRFPGLDHAASPALADDSGYTLDVVRKAESGK